MEKELLELKIEMLNMMQTDLEQIRVRYERFESFMFEAVLSEMLEDIQKDLDNLQDQLKGLESEEL